MLIIMTMLIMDRITDRIRHSTLRTTDSSTLMLSTALPITANRKMHTAITVCITKVKFEELLLQEKQASLVLAAE
ncbi:MAG: hypothetical protein RRY40_00800 [Oscillospiraceae bacterium]